jgi:hypothetical protein
MARMERRVFARLCVDLTQQRRHLGGALGAAFLRHYVEHCWILRSPEPRIVTITLKGHMAFKQILDFELAVVEALVKCEHDEVRVAFNQLAAPFVCVSANRIAGNELDSCIRMLLRHEANRMFAGQDHLFRLNLQP